MSLKAYPCIGGPLNGQYATSTDFQQEMVRWQSKNDPATDWIGSANPNSTHIPLEKIPGGRFSGLRDVYRPYNAGSRNNVTSMVWIHMSLLKPAIPASKR